MMENEKFEQLLIAVRGEGLATVRGEQIKQVLGELLTGEFSGIKETKFKIMLKQPKGGGEASVNVVDGTVFLWISPDVQKESLRAILRHELLHLETGMLDDSHPAFKQAARERGIDLWRV